MVLLTTKDLNECVADALGYPDYYWRAFMERMIAESMESLAKHWCYSVDATFYRPYTNE